MKKSFECNPYQTQKSPANRQTFHSHQRHTAIKLRLDATDIIQRVPSSMRPAIWLPLPHHPGGDEGARTPGLRLAKAALSQLSYIPIPADGLCLIAPPFYLNSRLPYAIRFWLACGPDWTRTSDPCVISTVL